MVKNKENKHNLYNVHAYVVIILKLSQRFGTWVKKKSHNQMLVNEPKHTTSNLRSLHTLLQHTLSQLIIYCNVVELWTCSNSNTERCVQSSGDFIGRHWVMLISDEYFHKCCTWFNAPKFCTWMCLPDSENSPFAIPKKAQFLDPSIYHFLQKNTQFGPNCVLFWHNSPKYTQFCKLGALGQWQKPSHRYTKFHENTPQKAGTYTYTSIILSNPPGFGSVACSIRQSTCYSTL